MKKVASKRAKLLSALCLATLVPFGVGMAMLNANAEVDVTNFRIVSGAGVRLPNTNDDSGIRFTAQLPSTAFTSLTENQEKTVYFGIQLTGENNHTEYVCYYVDSKEKGESTNEREVEFAEGSTMFNYYASVLYNEAELKADLATSSTHNPDYDETKTDEENIEAFNETLLQQYLNKAYATELSACAYYQIGMDGEKVPVGFSAVRSIWGAASNAYITDATKYEGVANKYFSEINAEDVTVNYETGKVMGYDLADTDNVYYLGNKVSQTDDSIATSVYSAKQAGDTIQIAVVSKDGELTVLNAELVSTVKTISTLAYYDSAADKLYYTDENNEKQTLQGTAEYSFSYVVDAETSYALADYTSGSLVSNVNYKYADSVVFDNNEGATGNNSRGGFVQNLAPRINTADGYVTASIPYNPQTDVYTGVKVMIEDADGYQYSFTNTVITSQMIDNAAELDETFNKADTVGSTQVTTSGYVLRGAYISRYGTITKGVYMLANDIDCSENFTFDNSYWNFFEGVFDGRGHNIYNLDVSGTEAKPGNGLFSALSTYSAVQNVGFINVKANYGSVFQGNLYDITLSAYTTHGTYAAYDGTTSNAWNNYGPIYYRRQLGIPDTDTTSLITAYLKDTRRQGDGEIGKGYWQNVYVQVDPTTVRLMGVISRNMVNNPNNLRANNLVIEYLPTQLFDSAEGANDGALPFGYNYTNGKYGVVFGGAYYQTNGIGGEFYDCGSGGAAGFRADSATEYFTLGGNDTYAHATSHSKAALTFTRLAKYTRGTWFNSKIYVISPMGLVSTGNGEVLATNETKTSDTQYQFEKVDFVVYPSYGTQGAEHTGETSKLERYNTVADFVDAYKDYTAEEMNHRLTSYMLDNGAEENYWDISGGYLQWKNIPQTQE